MINERHDTYQYFKPQSNTFYKSDFIDPINNPIDIVLDLNHFKAINNLLQVILLDLSKYQVSKGRCLVVVKSDITDFFEPDSLIVVPTLEDAKNFIQMERIQRDLGF